MNEGFSNNESNIISIEQKLEDKRWVEKEYEPALELWHKISAVSESIPSNASDHRSVRLGTLPFDLWNVCQTMRFLPMESASSDFHEQVESLKEDYARLKKEAEDYLSVDAK